MSKPRWFLEVRHTPWVFWGYGKDKSVVHMDPAKLDLGHGMTIPFKLPSDVSGLAKPRVYDRRKGYGWRWQHQNGAGHSWHAASSVEDAVEQARDSLASMRTDTRAIFERAVEDVRVSR